MVFISAHIKAKCPCYLHVVDATAAYFVVSYLPGFILLHARDSNMDVGHKLFLALVNVVGGEYLPVILTYNESKKGFGAIIHTNRCVTPLTSQLTGQ